MPYEVLLTKPTHRRLRKLHRPIRKALVAKAQKLAQDPTVGDQLHGRWSFLRSLHLRIKGADSRIIYEVVSAKRQVIIHHAGPRENIYKQLKSIGVKPAA